MACPTAKRRSLLHFGHRVRGATSDTELSISRELNGLLRAKQVTVAVAEGSSGVRISERLVRYAGVTAFFKGSV